ncbi:hypothetical protein ACFQHV_11500 [Promicromonospora thailandica]|uniref:Uncharacterized protein n=1 Tax=Promicromonospora thailandica TaxID=765201 RepID=A0A9X2GAS5_9MICO|nr:hypothetical protein [Promicromonospora thailandica]MCP2265011.1 hypothetical protein [Promicromonospora thailandica]
MDARFPQREDGQVDIDLGPEWTLFTEALNDCVSSRPPRGAVGNGPSTYWVDVALGTLDSALASGSDRPFTWGNATLMRLKAGRVEARNEYDGDDIEGQFLEVETLRDLLARWRREIVRSAAGATSALSETYRRNPMPDYKV